MTKAELEERIRQMGQPILQRLHPDDIDAIARRVVEIQKEPGESTPSISNDKVRELLKNPKKK